MNDQPKDMRQYIEQSNMVRSWDEMEKDLQRLEQHRERFYKLWRTRFDRIKRELTMRKAAYEFDTNETLSWPEPNADKSD